MTMTENEFGEFEHECYEYLKAKQDILMSEYGMGGYERWDYDQETGEFVFSDGGIPKLIADFQAVGTISKISKTWLWSWANPSIEESVKEDVRLVRRFGEEHGLKELTEEKWAADELDGWAMTNVTAKLLNAIGAYRCPDEDGALFVVFTAVWRPSA
jgi:hypothetical protein